MSGRIDGRSKSRVVMPLKFAVVAFALCVLLIEGGVAQATACPYTVSVLDVPGVQCTTAVPCSGTYYATGLSQGVGACPTGSSCALLPLTPIMGCAAAGRPDLIYVNADGSLTKDGRSVTLSGTTAVDATLAPSSSSSSNSRTGKNTGSSESSSSDSHSSKDNSSDSNASSGSQSMSSSSDDSKSNADSDSTADSGNSTSDDSATNSSSYSWSSESGSGSYTISPGSSSANQQAQFNPGDILSDSSKSSKSSSGGGLGLGSIIAIVVGCLAVVAIAAGARLLKKGKDAELATPEAGAEAYGGGGGGGGGGMTPKENVLLL